MSREGVKSKKKKKSIDENEESETPTKKPKIDFNEVNFKHMLKDPNTTFLGKNDLTFCQ